MRNRMKAPLRALIVDHNGTMVDDSKLTYEVLQEICRICGVGVPAFDHWRRYESVIGYLRYYHDYAQLPKTIPVASYHMIRELYYGARIRSQAPFRPDLVPFLRSCQEWGVQLAVCSGELRVLLDECLSRDALRAEFEIIEGDVTDKRAMLISICERLRVPVEQAAYVDDTISGIAAADAAGLIPIAFAHHTSYSKPEQLRKEGQYEHIVSTFTELGILVEGLVKFKRPVCGPA